MSLFSILSLCMLYLIVEFYSKTMKVNFQKQAFSNQIHTQSYEAFT